LRERGILNQISDNLNNIKNADDLFYCIYTSGTTGQPKGTCVKENAILSFFYDFIKRADSPVLERVLISNNYAYAASIQDIFFTWMSGGCGYLISDKMKKDTRACAEFIAKNKILFLFSTPSYFEVLSSEHKDIIAGSLKAVVLAGERFKLAKEFLADAATQHMTVINIYGQTEAFLVSVARSSVGVLAKKSGFHMGTPAGNARIYILNGIKLCGIGVAGEICIASDGLIGYINNPKLTSEKFVRNPFGKGLLFRTGDQGCWTSEGNIEFIGRNDDQIKIRGFRVETGEIESRIRSVQGVKDCVVTVRTESDGNQALCAYYIGSGKTRIEKIKEELSLSLPEFMIPSYIMQLDRFPVNRNGKLDRRALPEIVPEYAREYEAPVSSLEEKICGIFCEILGTGRIGRKDDFFRLGGHSLRATRLVNRLESLTGCRIAVNDIFTYSTPEKISALLETLESGKYNDIPNAEKREFYPMTSVQKGIFLSCQKDSGGILYNIPKCYRIKGNVDFELLNKAFQKMIERHEALRTEFLMKDEELVQRILGIVKGEINFVKNPEASDQELMNEFIRPFDLGKAPLVRAQLIDRGDGYLFCLDMHHIVGDGMSMNTFMREFSALYNGGELEKQPRQFKDYSEWMAERDLSSQEKYWKEQFEEDAPVLDMPLDFTRPQEQSFAGSKVLGSTGRKLGRKIEELAAKTGTTTYMVMLSAAMVLLSKYSRQEDIVIGSPISGRTHRDTEGMLGMFVNTLAMRGKPEGKKRFEEFLGEMKGVCLHAYENQEYPFEELVEVVEVQRDLSRNPLFDVMLVMQNNEQAQLSIDGAS
ncbi:MAG: AMP-binding protein, partial [Lachnospiraceae bacterium]|nr:AMP-binding protein [Lachnospiraceae bacterium]